ncbi:MAG: hypothetical protein RLZZ381_1487 [Cyanobacteriota bacterium]|jgi:hypothetical protein
MLQIKQLNSTKCITSKIQKIIHGGQRPYSLRNRDEKTDGQLWRGYASGDYNVSKTTSDDGDPIAKFTETRGTDNSDKTYTIGTIAL